jgi:DNA-binding CsgD family transcriptional regulator
MSNAKQCNFALVPVNQIKHYQQQGFFVAMFRQGLAEPPLLTDKERQALRYYALDGLCQKAVAAKKRNSVRAVNFLLASCRDKLNVRTDNALVAKVFTTGLHSLL